MSFSKLRALAVVFWTLSQASSALSETIASVKLEDLFKEANVVALVRIVSGDSEHYSITVYKSEVLMAFKGTTAGGRIYVGPFIGLGVGEDHLVFLRTSQEQINQKRPSTGLSYGDLPAVPRIMYAGYADLEIDYACVFGSECDWGVIVNPEQIILPASIETYPSGRADATTNYKKWVRRDAIVSYLEQMKTNSTARPANR